MQIEPDRSMRLIVYHTTKSEESYEAIRKTKKLLPGRNVSHPDTFVHLSLKPTSALEALIIGIRSEAWILELEIDDQVKLEPDPSGDWDNWVVYPRELAVQVLRVMFVHSTDRWHMHKENPFFESPKLHGQLDAIRKYSTRYD